MPASALGTFVPSVARIVVTPVGGETATIHLDDRGRVRALTEDPVPLAAVGDVLRSLPVRPGTPVGLRLRHADVFVRQVTLPAGLHRNVAEVLELDIERSTPFKSGMVYSAAVIDRERLPGGSISVRHYIAKRKAVDQAAAVLSRAGFTASFADVWNDAHSEGVAVDLLPGRRAAPSRLRQLATAALAAVVIASLAAGIASVVAKEMELRALTADASRLAPEAEQARRGLALERQAENERRSVQGFVDSRPRVSVLLDDVSRLLPDTVWLQEFKLDGTTLELAGSARSAAETLMLLERSGQLRDAQFVAPVRPEADSERELFRLRAKLRDAPGAETPSAGDPTP